MKDEEILRLYRQRDEQAIAETQKQYGALCYTIACNVLRDRGDAEECVNDTWRRAWDRIPPDEPQSMAAYLGRVTRNLALNRLQKQNRLKRGGGEMTLIWEELAELIPAGETPETQWERQAFGRVLDDFLRELPPPERVLFLRRYWWADSLGEAAAHCGIPVRRAKSVLARLRKALRSRLEKEEIML